GQDSEEPIVSDFELSETLWAKASIPPTDRVNLWLGANVMLEYPIGEAKDLLTSKLASARLSLEQVDEDLEFIKEQITTVEVNMARVYNEDVRRRRQQTASA
ncbi:Prefoldin subunit 3, partial [Entophlyctis helioformis]